MLVVKGFSTPHTTLLASPQVERGDKNPSLIFNPSQKKALTLWNEKRGTELRWFAWALIFTISSN